MNRMDNTQNKLPANKQRWLGEVEQFILFNLQDHHLTVSRVADEFFLSERQFHRKIKQLSGLTANQFITSIRLKKAKSLLESGGCSTLKEVAISVGYCRAEYLSKLYENQYGKRPVQFLEPAE